MYKNIAQNILYWLSVAFLVISVFVYVDHVAKFKWTGLFGTDALTLYGELATLISMISIKIPLVRKFLAWLLLTVNYSQIDYKVSVMVSAGQEIRLDAFKEVFTHTISSCGLFTHNDFNEIRSTALNYKIYHRGLAGNLEIKMLHSDNLDGEEESQNGWKIELDGVSTYRVVSKNVRFITNNYLDSLYRHHVLPSKLVLTISNRHTEYSLADKGILLSARKHRIADSRVTIAYNVDTSIIIDSATGLSMTSRSRADFTNAFESIKQILIS